MLHDLEELFARILGLVYSARKELCTAERRVCQLDEGGGSREKVMAKQAGLRKAQARLCEVGDVKVRYDVHIVTCRGYGCAEGGSSPCVANEGSLIGLQAAAESKDVAGLL